MPSASKSALLLSPCIRWAAPGARVYEDEFANTEKRDMGTDFHHGMDLYYQDKAHGWSSKWPKVTAWWHLAVRWSQEHLEPRLDCRKDLIESEVYVAYNFSTGEFHEDKSVHDRKYPDMPGFLPGTADVVCILSDGSLLVGDWKTGGGTGADKQLLTLALGLREVFIKADGTYRLVRLAILYVTDEGVHPVEWVATESDLLAHKHAMAFQLADVGVRNDPVPGIHCTQLYCPHLAYCPGITAVVESASEAPQGLLPPERLVRKHSISDAPLDTEQAGYIMERVTAARRQMDFYETRVRKYVTDGGRCIAGNFEFSKKADGFRWRTKKD